MTSLKSIIADAKQQSHKNVLENKGAEAVAIMGNAVKNLTVSGIEDKAVTVGNNIGEATLLNGKGEEVLLSTLLKGKPAIIDFYRGTWCRYCNLELSYYNELLEDDKSIRMIAISPERPNQSQSDQEGFNFPILSDVDNKFAKKLNLVYDATKELVTLYKEKLGIDLEKSQGNNNGELPLPATYVVDGNGKITYAYMKADYTDRAEPEEVIAEYKKLVE